MAFSSPQYFAYATRLVAGCLTPRGREVFRRNLHSLSLPPVGRIAYPDWLAARIAARAHRHPPRSATGMFSFLTTVYDTKARYVRALRDAVLAQTVQDFEWVVLDNGSTDKETIAAIDELRADGRVRCERVEQNVGILGGIAHCLRRATGRYVLPLDSDDLLTPDALAVFAQAIATTGEPPLLYSDEDKVRDAEVPFEAFHKPDWDPVLFWNSCYIAHLCAIRRDLALQLGVYTDDAAKGCHDWDTFFRFLRAGYTPVHVPEIVYSWRMHAQSCAGNIFSKAYVRDSHAHVLGGNLAQVDGGDRFELAQSPLFQDTPDWWIRRRHVAPLPLTALHIGATGSAVPAWLTQQPLVAGVASLDAGSLQGLDAALATLRSHDPDGRGLVLLVSAGVEPRGDEWPWEAMGLCERFPDVAVVGGRLLHQNGTIWSAGEVIGYDGLLGSPDRGRQAFDPGWFAWLRKQRSVSAVHAAFCLVRSDFLRDFAAQHAPASAGCLGGWLSAHSQARGRRVVFSPLIEATVPTDQARSEDVGAAEAGELLRRYPHFLAGERYYAGVLGLEPQDAFAAVFDDVRQRALERLRHRYGVPATAG
jgi:hypothetical protein